MEAHIASSNKLRFWRENPVSFVKEVFKIEPDPWQVDALNEFSRTNRIAMLASKGVGKTACLSWMAWNFLVTRPFPKVIATSISYDNLSDGLWTEMATWQQKSELLKTVFEWTKTRIFSKQNQENWFMSARTWSKGADSSKQADTLAGIHADYVLFLLDEAGGYPDAVAAAAEAALASGIETKLVIAGNPTHLSGPLYRAATSERDLWKVININSDPENPKRSTRVSIQWAREQIQKYGRENPYVMVNVFGQFPPSNLNSLLGINEVTESTERRLLKEAYEFSQKRIGVDVARQGDDSTVIFPRQGLCAFNPVELKGARSNEVAARVILAKNKWKSDMEFIDGTGGYGAGVVDNLIAAGYSPQEINFSGKSTDPRYFNKRSEMWFNMAEWIKRGGQIPNHGTLIKELCAPTYTFHNGKFMLEPKEQIKARLGFSTDFADALCLTFALPEMIKNILPGMEKTKVKVDYDPFSDERLNMIK